MLKTWRRQPLVRRLTIWGFVGAGLLYVALCLVHVYGVPIYKSGDEGRHVWYSLILNNKGRLPTINETRAANHPPLYYFLAKYVLDDGKNPRAVKGSVRDARLMCVFFGGLGLLYVFLIVRALVPKQPAVALFAMATIAVMPSYDNTAATAANDALGAVCQLGVLYSGLSLLVHGPRWWRYVHIALFFALGGLVRVSALLIMPAALVAVLGAVWFHSEGSRGRRIGKGVGICAALGMLCLLTSGWFYWDNYQSCGEPTCVRKLVQVWHRKSRGGTLVALFDFKNWLRVWDGLWGRLAGRVRPGGELLLLDRLLGTVAAVGAIVRLVRVYPSLRLQPWWSSQRLSWLVAAVGAAGVLYPGAMAYGAGFSLYPRYVFGAVWFIGMVMAMGFSWLRAKLYPLIGYCLVLGLSLGVTFDYVVRFAKRGRSHALSSAFKRGGIDNPDILAMCTYVAFGVGAALVLWALAELHRWSTEQSG